MLIYGHSDDIVCVNPGDPEKEEEYECPEDGEVRITVGHLDPLGVEILMSYGKEAAVWGAEVRQIGDGVRIPWPVRIKQHNSGLDRFYTVEVTVDCPPGTPVMVECRKCRREWVKCPRGSFVTC